MKPNMKILKTVWEIIIPVHDSIVVKEKLEPVAREIMEGCFSQVLGNSFNCVIT